MKRCEQCGCTNGFIGTRLIAMEPVKLCETCFIKAKEEEAKVTK